MDLASLASMVFPKQPMTLLSFGHTSPPVTKGDLERYLCAKLQIRQDTARESGSRRCSPIWTGGTATRTPISC